MRYSIFSLARRSQCRGSLGPWLALWLGPDSWLLVAEAPLAHEVAEALSRT